MYAESSLLQKARKFLRLLARRYAFPPNDLTLELSTACGERCGVCYRFAYGVPETTMSEETFAKVLERLAEAYGERGPAYLSFVGLGEPTRHPRLEPLLRTLRRRFPRTRINLSSNLGECGGERLRVLLSEGLVDRVSVSVDDPEAAGPAFHPFGPAHRANLAALMRLRAELRPELGVRIQTLISTKEQLRRVLTLAEAHGVRLVQLIRLDLHGFGARPPVVRPPLEDERALVRWARGEAAARGLEVWHNNEHDLLRRWASRDGEVCLLSDDHLFIDVEGRVLPCFGLRGHPFGDLRTESLAEIHRKPARRAFYDEQAALCAGCDTYKDAHRHP
ncbi:MAG: radical SAM protein [Elusimicrobiota bacterium]|jgi:MoaA/NifB/PqqE/SkfB family radical SAM enzyme